LMLFQCEAENASSEVRGGEERFGLNTASAGVVSGNCQADVTLITPGGVPGVLNEPVFLTSGLIGAPADCEDGVVESGSASGAR
jgi:hypothetical protein